MTDTKSLRTVCKQIATQATGVLGFGLSFNHRSGHRASRLHNVEVLYAVPLRVNETFVLMAPDHQVEEIVDELLRDVIGSSMLRSKSSSSHGLYRFKGIYWTKWLMTAFLYYVRI